MLRGARTHLVGREANMSSERDRNEGTDSGVAIRISDDDTQAHAQRVKFASPEDEARFVELLAKAEAKAEKVRVRLSPSDDRDDVEGHTLNATAVLATIGLDDDDTEGHAISIHFPSAEEARRFRMQLLAAGALTATLALGATAGIALGPGFEGQISTSGAQAVTMDTAAQMREGGALSAAQAGSLGQAGSVDTAAQLREGGALSAGQAGSVDTAAQLREGGALSAGQAGSTDTAAQLREGGALSSGQDDEEGSDTAAKLREGGSP
jgi:hypothetical protein